MDWILWGIILAIIVIWMIRRSVGPRYLTNLTNEQFKEGYRKAQLIDVREPREYKTGHILGARNIPLSQLKQRVNEIRTDQPVYLYCQSGNRSRQAARIIKKERGTEDIYHLQKGFRKWTGKIKK
ncbi:rhodanese-like domain-containing protein [Aliibacillus thermotolerans]|uniref:Rhodanese-like domain-containing protein n=1 Tax=Aliibacillus thermotolerans TaxID=1834418 RepID=A0ABW0U6T1_9BACI|nr:rhodanese-like domain-containing protein [Aliibacillus thermotolerans]MDA3131111.1 rhodanese-like domain-containing protein [Aliibacillus thermotolerans]